MAISTVIAALQVRHAALTGVTSAPTAMPASLASSMLPIVLVLPGEATWSTTRIGGPALQERVMLVRCYVAPVAQGQGVDQGYTAAVALLETFGDSYRTDFSAGTGYQMLRPFTDTGHVIMAWGNEGQAYHGFEFKLTVRELA